MNEGIAGLIIAGYALTVIFRGNGKQLVSLLGQEQAFVKWFAAVLILLAISKRFGDAGNSLIIIAAITMLLILQQKGQLKTVFDSFNALFGRA